MVATVTFSGPYFDARYDEACDQLNYDLEDAVAQQAMADWHHNLERSLRFPTGFYESHITMQSSPSASGGTSVTDLGVIYGHWLEGDGSRNAPKTRFPGYWSARRATVQVQAKVEELSHRPVEHFLEKVNDGG
jgi:hypothetical protein